jgi:S1-C subfamily serine protease
VSALDVVLLLLLGLSAWGGYRRGALLQVTGLIGLGAGFAVGVWAAPRVAELVRSTPAKAAAALGTVFLLGFVGDAFGSLVGIQIRRRAHGARFATRFKKADAVGGATLSAAALILTIWFLGVNLAAGPFPGVARAMQRSFLVRAVDAALPPPPSLTAEIGSVLDVIGFPDVFSGLPPPPSEPVPDAPSGLARQAAEQARASVVLIQGPACDRIVQGTGFVVAEDLVLTNAHVVAGSEPRVEWNERLYRAEIVVFDDDLDVAVLRVEGLDAPALDLREGEVDRGAGGAVVGFPHGRYAELGAAARRALDAVGRDIYGDDEVSRRIYELQVHVEPGNSGGPFVLPDGDVAGLIFGASVSNDDLGYAITSPTLEPIVSDAEHRTRPVDHGPCVA